MELVRTPSTKGTYKYWTRSTDVGSRRAEYMHMNTEGKIKYWYKVHCTQMHWALNTGAMPGTDSMDSK